MTGIDSYSTTPATNATATGGSVNWAEGQAPSTVNNTARQEMADIRSHVNDLIWFQYGTGDQGAGNVAVPGVYASATSFTITGADVHTVYHVGRRVRAVGSSTGTIYGTISASSYNGGNSTTTVTVVWDSGSLSNETLTISLSQVPVTGNPCGGFQTWTPTDQSGASLVLTINDARYARIGNIVIVTFDITYPATANGSVALISLPVAPNASFDGGTGVNTNCGTAITAVVTTGTNPDLGFQNASSGVNISNSTLSTKNVRATIIYSA